MDRHSDSINYLKVASNCEFAISALIDYSIRIWNLNFVLIEKVYQSACFNEDNIFLTHGNLYIYSVNRKKNL